MFENEEHKQIFWDYVRERIKTHRTSLNNGNLIVNGHVFEVLNALVPKELKHKKDVPTVIEYQGRRYILDHGNNK